MNLLGLKGKRLVENIKLQGVFELVESFSPCGNFAVSLLRKRIVGIRPSFLEGAKLAAKTSGV